MNIPTDDKRTLGYKRYKQDEQSYSRKKKSRTFYT